MDQQAAAMNQLAQATLTSSKAMERLADASHVQVCYLFPDMFRFFFLISSFTLKVKSNINLILKGFVFTGCGSRQTGQFIRQHQCISA